MDEDEFEISATDTGQQRSVRAPRGAPPLRRPPLRRPPRGVTVGLIAACVVLVTTGLALASVPNLSGRVNVLLYGTPTATPRIVPGGNLLYVEGGLAFPRGQLTVNGALTAIDEYTTVAAPTPITLARGVNVIEYHADPFPVLRCRISVPASKSDTCPLDSTYQIPNQTLAPAVRALNLTPSLAALPVATRADLDRLVRAHVTIQSTPVVVQAGERYVDNHQQIVVADQPLLATFSQTLATEASSSSNGCAVWCIAPLDTDNSVAESTAGLLVEAHVVQGFRSSTAAGQLVLTNAPISASSDVPNDALAALTVTWNEGAWQVATGASQSYPLACLAATQALTPHLVDPSQGNTQVLSVAYAIAAPNPADGCVFRLSDGGAYVNSPTASAYLHVLYRFGVVLVVENTSLLKDYVQLKDLPYTDATETALAWQIDATQPYS